MSRTITALFDSRDDADRAKGRLRDANIDTSDLDIVDQSRNTADAGYSTHEHRGFWEALKGVFLPDEDRHQYEEGVRRGGYLLSGEVEDRDADQAIRLLDEAGPVDVEGRAGEWRKSGWDYAGVERQGEATDRAYAPNTGEERIPVIEERLRVGKREINRGGVRVRSYVVEEPVNEQVELRDERVSVERRPVDQPLSGANDDAFRERTIEMTETAEEAVISKDARIVEEVVVRKDSGTHTETVSDTVRRTEVDVDDTGTRQGDGLVDRTATSGSYDRSGSGLDTDRDRDRDVPLGDRVAGAVKEGTGELTGNESLERRGEAQQGKTSID